MTPTTLAADAEPQGVTDLIARLKARPIISGPTTALQDEEMRAWQEEAAAALTALSAENAELKAQVAELTRERDREYKRAINAKNALVAVRSERDGLRNAVAKALDAQTTEFNRRKASEAKAARLEGALRDICKLPYESLRWRDIARAALTEGTPE